MTLLRKIAVDLLHGKLPAIAAEDLTRKRLEMCEGCEYFTQLTHQCKLCGCFMEAKAKLLEAECPLEKW